MGKQWDERECLSSMLLTQKSKYHPRTNWSDGGDWGKGCEAPDFTLAWARICRVEQALEKELHNCFCTAPAFRKVKSAQPVEVLPICAPVTDSAQYLDCPSPQPAFLPNSCSFLPRSEWEGWTLPRDSEGTEPHWASCPVGDVHHVPEEPGQPGMHRQSRWEEEFLWRWG